MAHLDGLLDAIGEYIKVKQELEASSTASCHEWDCGLSTELADSFLDPAQRQRLDSAKSAFAEALKHCIDARVRAALKEGCRE